MCVCVLWTQAAGDYSSYGYGQAAAHYANPYCYYPYMSSPLGASMVAAAPSTQTYQLLPPPPPAPATTAGARHVTFASVITAVQLSRILADTRAAFS